MRWLNAIKIK